MHWLTGCKIPSYLLTYPKATSLSTVFSFIAGSSVHQSSVMLLFVHHRFLCTSNLCHAFVCSSPVPLYIKSLSRCCLSLVPLYIKAMSCCCLFITSSSVHQSFVMLLSVYYQFLCTSNLCHAVVYHWFLCTSRLCHTVVILSYCCLFITGSSVHQSYVTLRSVYQCMCSFGTWTTFVRCGTGEVSATLTTCEHCALPAIRPSPHSRRPSALRPGDSPRQPALGTLLPSSKKPDGLSTVLRPRAEHLVQTSGASLGMLRTQVCLHRMMLLMLL